MNLKDAYFTVPIYKQDRDFPKFTFKGNVYRFRCLPFGLTCAPWVFTKTLKSVSTQLRQLGVKVIMYIGRDTRTGEKACHRPYLSPRKPGIHSQFPKVRFGANPSNRFPGLPSRLSQTGTSAL